MPAISGHKASPGAYRSKRARYAPRACKECQRRKVKCDGGSPCARCSGQSFACTYRSMTREAPVEQNITSASADSSGQEISERIRLNINDRNDGPAPAFIPRSRSREGSSNVDPHRAPPGVSGNTPDYNGPTSTEFTFDTVNGRLQALGMQSAIPDQNLQSNFAPTPSGRLAQYGPLMKVLTMDPLWDLDRENAYMLIDDWFEGLGSIYPIISRYKLSCIADRTFGALDEARSGGLKQKGGSVAEAIFDHDANALKIVLAIGMTKKAGGREFQAQRLFQSTSEAIEGLIWNPEGLQGIQLLFLVAMYHYHLNEEVRTGRCIAFAARLCLETGLHRRAMLGKMFPGSTQCMDALQAFWAVYMLERRLSLGQGIPFSIQDSYIDRSVYTVDHASPVLMPLLQWTRLAGKTWHALNNQVEKTYDLRVDEIDCLDSEIKDWSDKLSDEYRLEDSVYWTLRPPTYYHSVFFVRKAHLRNLIYRPILQLPSQAGHHEPILLKAIEISRDTIRTLHRLNQHTSLIRTHPMFFQQLLLTAFGNLLLAVVGTGPNIRDSTRAEFDMFLQLFQYLGSKCTALRQTWQRLQGLRDLHTRLGHLGRSALSRPAADSNAVSHLTETTTLSFDDIFHSINFSTSGESLAVAESSDVHVEGEALYDVSEGFPDLENLFNFPFLGLADFNEGTPWECP